MKYLLLDDLAQYFGLTYVSELKSQKSRILFKEYIQTIRDDAYTLDDWRDACAYLTGITTGIRTIDEAKRSILNWLNS